MEDAPEETSAEAGDEGYTPPTHFEIGAWRVPLRTKVKLSAAYPILQLCSDDQSRLVGMGAAIGYVWENAGTPRFPLPVRYRASGGKWADYGAAVVDGLYAKGVTVGEILAAGTHCFLLINREANLYPSNAEVDEAAGN